MLVPDAHEHGHPGKHEPDDHKPDRHWWNRIPLDDCPSPEHPADDGYGESVHNESFDAGSFLREFSPDVHTGSDVDALDSI